MVSCIVLAGQQKRAGGGERGSAKGKGLGGLLQDLSEWSRYGSTRKLEYRDSARA